MTVQITISWGWGEGEQVETSSQSNEDFFALYNQTKKQRKMDDCDGKPPPQHRLTLFNEPIFHFH